MIGIGVGVSKLRRRGGGGPFDFSSIPDLGMCLLPGQGYTEVAGGLDVWQSQFTDTYAEAFTASMRPALQTDSETGLLVPHFDGLDDRMLLYNSNGSNYQGGVGTTFYLIRSDGFKTSDEDRMMFFTKYERSNAGYSLYGALGNSSTFFIDNYGSPNFRNNKQAINYVNRGEIWNAFYGKTDLRLSTEISGDISSWQDPQIGGFRDEVTGIAMYQGLAFGFLHYKRVLTTSEIETVENELEKLIGVNLPPQ